MCVAVWEGIDSEFCYVNTPYVLLPVSYPLTFHPSVEIRKKQVKWSSLQFLSKSCYRLPMGIPCLTQLISFNSFFHHNSLCVHFYSLYSVSFPRPWIRQTHFCTPVCRNSDIWTYLNVYCFLLFSLLFYVHMYCVCSRNIIISANGCVYKYVCLFLSKLIFNNKLLVCDFADIGQSYLSEAINQPSKCLKSRNPEKHFSLRQLQLSHIWRIHWRNCCKFFVWYWTWDEED